MAYQSTLLLALLLTTTASIAHGLFILNGIDIVEVNVTGLLACSVNGNPSLGCPGIAGVNVFITCGGTTNLGQATTNASGSFQIVIQSLLDVILIDLSTCIVVVNLPIVSCTVLPLTGTLQAVPALLGLVQGLLGAVANFNCGASGFTHYP